MEDTDRLPSEVLELLDVLEGHLEGALERTEARERVDGATDTPEMLVRDLRVLLSLILLHAFLKAVKKNQCTKSLN